MKIELKILDDRVKIEDLQPKTAGSAGIDLMAVRFIDNDIHDAQGNCILEPWSTVMIGTGIAVHIDHPHYAGLILPRSSSGRKGLVLANSVGLLDSDYQGELMIAAWNRSNWAIKINRLDRIAQLIITPVIRPEFQIVESFAASERGDGGFGSTGV